MQPTQSGESGGQASGGSQMDWCSTVAACIIQSTLYYLFLSSSHVNEPKHSIWRRGMNRGLDEEKAMWMRKKEEFEEKKKGWVRN